MIIFYYFDLFLYLIHFVIKLGRKMDIRLIRAMLVDRAQLQHESRYAFLTKLITIQSMLHFSFNYMRFFSQTRVLESSFTLSDVTPAMKMILKDSVQLATSQ